jgi:hypothetical protein
MGIAKNSILVWLTLAVIAGLFIFLISIEGWLLVSSTTPRIPADHQAGLHEVAVASMLQQSSVFSQWAIALIAGAWITLTGPQPIGPLRTALFLSVCAVCLLTLFLGQSLVQRVILDIQYMKDPLHNMSNWQFLGWQFRMTATGALMVAVLIVWRYGNA